MKDEESYVVVSVAVAGENRDSAVRNAQIVADHATEKFGKTMKIVVSSGSVRRACCGSALGHHPFCKAVSRW